MLDNKQIFQQSLVNHIYFAGSIRSFCTTIGLTFFKNNQAYIDRAIAIGRRATEIINQALLYTDKSLANEVLKNEVLYTEYTSSINKLTEELFDIDLEGRISEDKKILETRNNINYDNTVMLQIDELNNQGLALVNDFKSFVSEIKNKLNSEDLFSYLYPDFFNYMYEEISVYGRDIDRIISKEDYTTFYLNEYAYYFNELLRKSSEYIRGFLDTSHQDVFDMATYYIGSFANLTERYLKTGNNDTLSDETKRLVINYKSFVTSLIEKILRSELYFITPAIVLDNFLTNINAYLFIIDYAKVLSN